MSEFRIRLDPENLSEGSAEEKAAFGLLSIEAAGILLSAGFGNLGKRRRDGPLVSGYHLAEWLLWNWWRLRHEPRPSARTMGWRPSHCMAEIGEGYNWPNITISSDGFRSMVEARPSKRGNISSFRYDGAAHPVILPWSTIERGIDDFVGNVRALTSEKGLRETNLDRLWWELTEERENEEDTRFRRVEALLGADPDELPEEAVAERLADAKVLGDDAFDELAASAAGKGLASLPTSVELLESAEKHGVETRFADSVAAENPDAPAPSEAHPAPEIGVSAARGIRELAGLRSGEMIDRRLAELAGVSETILVPSQEQFPVSFTISTNRHGDRTVLRGTREVSRRFGLSRLLGDRIIWGDAPMHPSTDMKTYRQKAQRAFAAELLAPIDAIVDQADGDYSDERKEEIAARFGVSPMVIDRQLKNNHHIERDDSDFADVA